MRVLFIQRPPGGGSMTGLLDLVRVLDRERYEPLALLLSGSDYAPRLREMGVEVLGPVGQGTTNGSRKRRQAGPSIAGPRPSTLGRMKELLSGDLAQARKLLPALRHARPDIVHHNNNPRANRASILAAAWLGIPQVCHVRFLHRYSPLVDGVISRLVDHYVFMSEAIARLTRTDIGIEADKGHVIYDPFDLSELAHARSRPCDLAGTFGVTGDGPVVCNVGRLVPWKGHDVFLDAMAAVRERVPDLRVLIVGSAAESPAGESFRAGLERRVEALGLADAVTFTGFRTDAVEIMAASDVVVHSATQPEPFGRVVVEAMASGTPVVAAAAGGPLEIVTHDETGMLVPPGNAPDLAEAVGSLLAAPARAAGLARAALTDVERRFSADRFAAQLEALYGSLTPGGSAGRGSDRQASGPAFPA